MHTRLETYMPNCGRKRIHTAMRKSQKPSDMCIKGKKGAWEGAQEAKMGPPWQPL